MIENWDHVEIGDEIRTHGRTLTHADIRMFIGATDASHPAHVDEEYAKQHPFGSVVVPGALTIGVVDGFVTNYLFPRDLQIAHYGYDKIRFLGPVFPGDSLHMVAKVVEKRERDSKVGLIKLEYAVLNQHHDQVLYIEDLQLVPRVAV